MFNVPAKFQVNPVVFKCFSQVRDCVDNDNRSAEDDAREARVLRAWADSRANDPAFAAMVNAAREQAAVFWQWNRPSAV